MLSARASSLALWSIWDLTVMDIILENSGQHILEEDYDENYEPNEEGT